jgi:hypothetical protein
VVILVIVFLETLSNNTEGHTSVINLLLNSLRNPSRFDEPRDSGAQGQRKQQQQ